MQAMRRRTTTKRRRLLLATALAVTLGLAGLVAPATTAGAQEPEPALPIIFVHGGAGSAAQYESQALRFDGNGYPAPVTALEYNSASIAAILGAGAALNALIDEIQAETGAPQVYVVGHSLGTSIMNGYLANPANAARVAKYVGVDGASNANCGVGNPDLSCMGIFAGTTGNVGGNNVYFNGTQTHVEAATSAGSFAAQYEFFTGEPPASTMVLPEPPGRVEISGRSVLFPANSGAVGSTLQIWEIHGNTGHRESQQPIAVFDIDESGDWGPVKIHGEKHYEFHIIRPDLGLEGHIYAQPFHRSNHLVRLLNTPAGSAVLTNTNVGDNHSAGVVIRNREWWSNHPTGQNDVLEITTTSASQGTEAAGNILTPATGNGSVGIHVHDAAATPGESTLNLLPFFPSQAFQTGVDVFMPATDPPDGTISFANAPRGDASNLQVINTANWASSGHRMGILFRDYDQDVETFEECMDVHPQLCRPVRGPGR